MSSLLSHVCSSQQQQRLLARQFGRIGLANGSSSAALSRSQSLRHHAPAAVSYRSMTIVACSNNKAVDSSRCSIHSNISPFGWQDVRGFASQRKNKKGGAKKKNAPSLLSSSESETARREDAAALQHKEWVQFQQSIAVDGFETGQTVTVQSTRKTRGGKALRKSKRSVLEEKILERQRLTDIGGGEYPPMRYSDEETERLLQEAYSHIPERAGKRGTRNLKRQENRWRLVREIRAKYKAQLADFQVRKMEKRSRKIQDVKAVLADAPTVCAREREYQAEIFRRWATTMLPGQAQAVAEAEAEEESRKVSESITA